MHPRLLTGIYMERMMSLLIDTSALVAARNMDDRNHKKAMAAMTRALKGEYGKIYITDYIFDEVVTLAYIRTRNRMLAHDIGRFALAKPINIRFIEPADFYCAWEIYQKYNDKRLSFTDCTILH